MVYSTVLLTLLTVQAQARPQYKLSEYIRDTSQTYLESKGYVEDSPEAFTRSSSRGGQANQPVEISNFRIPHQIFSLHPSSLIIKPQGPRLLGNNMQVGQTTGIFAPQLPQINKDWWPLWYLQNHPFRHQITMYKPSHWNVKDSLEVQDSITTPTKPKIKETVYRPEIATPATSSNIVHDINNFIESKTSSHKITTPEVIVHDVFLGAEEGNVDYAISHDTEEVITGSKGELINYDMLSLIPKEVTTDASKLPYEFSKLGLEETTIVNVPTNNEYIIPVSSNSDILTISESDLTKLHSGNHHLPGDTQMKLPVINILPDQSVQDKKITVPLRNNEFLNIISTTKSKFPENPTTEKLFSTTDQVTKEAVDVLGVQSPKEEAREELENNQPENLDEDYYDYVEIDEASNSENSR